MGSITVTAVDQYIRRTANVPDYTGNFTIAGWVKLGSSSAGTIRYLCGVTDSTGAGNSSQLVQWSDNNYVPLAASIGNPWTTAPSDDAWIYVALVQTSGSPTIKWWNSSGVIQDSQAVAGSSSGTAAYMAVGNQARTLGAGRIGKYAYWKVWDEALSEGTIESDMFSPTFVYTTNKNTGFADNGTDISGNGRDWTLTGTGTDSDTPPLNFPATGLYHDAVTRRYQHLLIR